MNDLEHSPAAAPDQDRGAPAEAAPARPFPFRRLLPLAAGAFLLLGGLIGYRTLGRPAPATAAAVPAVRVDGDVLLIEDGAPQFRYVQLEVASEQAALSPPVAPARVAVDDARAAPVAPPLPGRVEQVAVQLGQRVRAGERLVAVRSVALPELRRELESARATLAARTKIVERARDLVAVRALPEKELALAEQERAEAEIALRAAERKERSYRIAAGDGDSLYWLIAPRSGTVVDRRALVGMEVGPDRSEPLMTVADLDAVLVVADLPEREAREITAGTRAFIQGAALEGERVEGTVVHVAEIVDPVRRTVSVRIKVSNPNNRLRPNAFATVSFMPRQGTRVVVPAEAVVQDDQQAVVFVHTKGANGGSRFERRQVRLGRSSEGRAEILEGLASGETYVARGALLLLNAVDLGS